MHQRIRMLLVHFFYFYSEKIFSIFALKWFSFETRGNPVQIRSCTRSCNPFMLMVFLSLLPAIALAKVGVLKIGI